MLVQGQLLQIRTRYGGNLLPKGIAGDITTTDEQTWQSEKKQNLIKDNIVSSFEQI